MAEFLRIKVDRYDSNGQLSYPEQIGLLYDYTYNASRMSDDAPTINGKFLSKNQISFQVKDEGKPDVVYYNPFHTFVEYEGVKYYLLRPPISTKNNTEERYEYDFTFVSPIKKLQDKLFVDCVTYPFNENEEYFSNSTTFPIAVTAKEFARRLNYSGLVDLGFYVIEEDITTDSETKFLTIDKLSYLDAIKIFKETFEMDYYIESKSSEITLGDTIYNLILIRIKQYDNIVNDNELNTHNIIPFEYGSTNALMSITKTPKTDKVITRMTGIGSADNIPYYYPNETPKGGYLTIQIPNNDSQVHIVDKDVLNNVVNETDYFTHKSYDSGSGSIEWRENSIKTESRTDFKWYVTQITAVVWIATARTISTNANATKQITYTKYVELPENDIKLSSFYFTFDWKTCKNQIIKEIDTLVDNANVNGVGFGRYARLFKDHLKWYVFNQPLKSPDIPDWENSDFNPEEVLDGWFDIFIKDNAGNEIKLYSINGYYQIPNGDFNTETIELNGVEKKVTKIYVRLKTIADNRRLFVVPFTKVPFADRPDETNGENYENRGETYDKLFDQVYDALFKQNANNINYIQSLFDEYLQLVNPTWVHVKDVNGLNDPVVDFSKYGLEVADDYFYNITFERKDKYINPSPNLMPSIYRNSKGKRRFYDAIDYPRKVESNNVPIDQNAGEEQPINLEVHNNLYKKDNNTYLVFDNPIVDTSVIESVVEFEDIKPSIKFVVNDNGQPINKILGVAFDCQDENGEIDWVRENEFIEKEGNKDYVHPYFFVKLPALGFNLFTHASEKGAMSVSMTSGHSASCTFEIGVSEKSKKNFVALDPNNNLARDNNGNVICNRRVYTFNGASGKYDISDINITKGNIQVTQFPDKFEQQNDTTNNEVWIALKKDLNTFSTLMPAFESSISSGDEFVLLNIDLPLEYILNAERELSKAIIKELHEQNRDKVSFSVDFSSIFFEEDKANKGVGREDDYFINKLTENSCLEIKYLSKVYRLFVSNYTKTFSSDSVLPKITISVQENITPIKRITLNNLRPTISNENRFVTLNGINRDTLTIQKTTDNIWLNTSGIYESSDSVVDSLVTTGATIKTANFGVNSKGDLTINVSSKTSSIKDGSQVESVSIPKFYEDTKSDLEQLKSDIQSITNKVDEEISFNGFASYIWYGKSGSVLEVLDLFKDNIATVNVLVKLLEDDFRKDGGNFEIELTNLSTTDSLPLGYEPFRTYEFIFETQIGEKETNTLPNLDITFDRGNNEKDVYTLGHRDKFVVEITTYETTYSYRIKQNVASSFDKDFQKIQEKIKELNSNLNQKVGDVKVDNVSVVEDGVASIDLATPINEALNSLRIGLPNGMATLDSSGKVPQNQLPSYVDDVLEFDGLSKFPTTGESGKIYVDASTNKSYRWSGTKYTEISNSLAIGTINGTAADGGVAQSHYNDNTRHITDTERNKWNGKQNTNETIDYSQSAEPTLNVLKEDTLKGHLSYLAKGVKWIKSQFSKYLPLAGGTMTGNLNMGGKRINNGIIGDDNIYWGGNNNYQNKRIIDTLFTQPGNRLACTPASHIDVEYSRDNGETWLDYGLSDDTKRNIFTVENNRIYLGKRYNDGVVDVANDRVRITWWSYRNDVISFYGTLLKFIIKTTISATGQVINTKISKLSIGDYNNNVDNWVTMFEQAHTGWPIERIYNYATQISTSSGTTGSSWDSYTIGLRFEFSYGPDASEQTTKTGASLYYIKGFGSKISSHAVGSYGVPFNNQPFTYDSYQNATFPAKVTSNEPINYDAKIKPTQTGNTVTKTNNWLFQYLVQGVHWLRDNLLTTGVNAILGNVTASKFIKSGGTSSQFLKADGSVDSTSYQLTISDLSTIRRNATNGNTAYNWGNHASAGYAKQSEVTKELNNLYNTLLDEIPTELPPTDNSVTNTKIADNAVTTNKIRDKAIIGSKIGYQEISTDHIANSAITNEKLVNRSIMLNGTPIALGGIGQISGFVTANGYNCFVEITNNELILSAPTFAENGSMANIEEIVRYPLLTELPTIPNPTANATEITNLNTWFDPNNDRYIIPPDLMYELLSGNIPMSELLLASKGASCTLTCYEVDFYSWGVDMRTLLSNLIKKAGYNVYVENDIDSITTSGICTLKFKIDGNNIIIECYKKYV